MEKLEVTVRTDSGAGNIDFKKGTTFRSYLYTPRRDGTVILSEAHFVDGKNQVRPLGTYDPERDVTTPDVGSVKYRVKPIAADQLEEIRRMVHERNFG